MPLDLPATASRDEETSEPQSEEDVTRIDSLPEVITADMLRSRKGKGVELSRDFEIPAELLVGLDEADIEEEWNEEEAGKKGRAKGKAPAKPAAKGKAKKTAKPDSKSKGKKWRPQLEDDE